jgi:predicted ATPase/class 3 adenylate cyclase
MGTADLPSGTVTFLFTDLESSTRLWEQQPEAMRAALSRHDEILRGAVERHGGHVVKTTGDGVHAAFRTARDALGAAAAGQVELADADWGSTGPLRVRMGIHTGEAHLREGDYYGATLNRAARLTGVAHGGQVVCSQATADLARDAMSEGMVLADLGEHRLRDLSRPERIFQIHAPGLDTDFGPLASLDAFPGNLPSQVSSFIGRDGELAQVASALGAARVVTLTGVGGVGKTRLAMQVAAELLPEFSGGAWLVELGGVVSGEVVDEQLAEVLGVRSGPNQPLRAALVGFLRSRQTLVVLDNCEHLVEAVAELVEELSEGCPRLRLLATSREGLAVRGEHVVPVPVLSMPSDTADQERRSEAAELFVERAREVQPSFELTADNRVTVMRLCRRLDGLPLAIELAAARTRSLSPTEILAHLDRRFRLLTGGRRTAVKRQQTLQNAIDWSFDLLESDEQALLRRLGVFAGSFDLAAVESVAAGEEVDPLDVTDLIDRLVDKSLLVADTSGTSARYQLLETIRDYAWDRLRDAGEIESTSWRFAQHCLGFAEAAGDGLCSPDELRWSQRIETEIDNLRAALSWAINTGEVDIALRLIAALELPGFRWGEPFGSLAEQAATMQTDDPEHPLVAVALTSAAFHALNREGDSAHAAVLMDQALSAAARMDLPARARAQMGGPLASVLSYLGDSARFRDVAAMALAAARELGEVRDLAWAFLLQTPLAEDQEGAIAAGEESARYARQVGSPTLLAMSLMILGSFLAPVDPQRAEPILNESVVNSTLVGNEYTAAMARVGIGTLQAAQGETEKAGRTLLEAASHAITEGLPYVFSMCLIGLANALVDSDTDSAELILAWCDEQGMGTRSNPLQPEAIMTTWYRTDLVNMWARPKTPTKSQFAEQIAGLDEAEMLALITHRLVGSRTAERDRRR